MSTSRPPIRTAIIGAGRTGLETCFPQLLTLSDRFALTALCDPERERRDYVTDRMPECQTYRRLEDAAADPAIELAVITTRTEDHFANTLQFIKAGKWVLVETPPCQTPDEAVMLRAETVKAGGKLLIRQPHHFTAAFEALRDLIQNGPLTDIFRIGINRGTFLRRDDWTAIRRCSGGMLLTEAPGMIDQALTLFGSPAARMWADVKRTVSMGDAEDYFNIILRNTAGLTIDLRYTSSEVNPAPLFTVTGANGEIIIDSDTSNARLRYCDLKNMAKRRASVRTPPLNAEAQPETVEWIEETRAIDHTIPDFERSWQAVYDAIRENRPYPVGIDQTLEVLRIIAAAKKDSSFS